MKLTLADQRHLEASEGWLELGNWFEANEELEHIVPELRAHPSVLRVRWEIFAKAGKWEMAAELARGFSQIIPDNSWGYIQLAHCLHKMKQTEQACAVLTPIAEKFSNDQTINYNLACYCCQLGLFEQSLNWLERAIDLAGNKDVRIRALEDPDLEALWLQISEI